MNCQKDDIAVMVHSEFPENVGAMFRVLMLDPWEGGDWKCEALTYVETEEGRLAPGSTVWALDADLRPIRPQADDAECESKAWLPPVPNSTKETVE